MLEEQEIQSLISDMWTLHLAEHAWLDKLYEYTKGLRGRPIVPEGAGDELKELAKLSVKNVLSLVRDSFAQNLSVVGYRQATAKDTDQKSVSFGPNGSRPMFYARDNLDRSAI